MEDTIKRPPLPADLPERVYDECLQAHYLIWRPTSDFNPFLDDKVREGWECHCTACEERLFLEKKKHKIKSVKKCPRCGAAVKSVRYDQRMRTCCNTMYLQRGFGADVFVYLFDAYCDFDIENGRDVTLQTVRIWHFDLGTAREWAYRCRWDRDVQIGAWEPLRRCNEPRGITEYHLMPIDCKALQGSCLEYAQLGQMEEYLTCTQTGYDGACGGLINYLRTYVKSPRVTEMLIKGGYTALVLEKIGCANADVNRLINWRAKDAKRVFRGKLGKAELRALAGQSAAFILSYLENRAYGVQLSEVSLVQALIHSSAAPASLRERYGLSEKRVLKYLRRLHGKGVRLGDYADYLRQLVRLGNPMRSEEALFPGDFQAAHARASTRERLLMAQEQNELTKWKYRYRRRLLGKYAFRYGGMFVRAIDSAAEIILEGEQQDNCVAGYAARHMNGQTAIFVLRRICQPKKSWYTVQLDPETCKVIQCRGYDNKPLTAEEETEKEEFLRQWRKYLTSLGHQRDSA